MKKEELKVLYFEGAGCENTYRGDLNNCRIRTAFTNNDGKKIYLEILGYEKTKDDEEKYKRYPQYNVGEAIGFIDSCHYITDDQKIDDCNKSTIKGHGRHRKIGYSYEGILKFVNEELNCSFDSIEILGWLSGYRVFRNTTKETYNTTKALNYGDEFDYNIELEKTRKEIEQHFNVLEKSEGKKYPNFSLWVDEEDNNLLHLLRHFNGYNKHWIIRTDVINWKDSIKETLLGKYAC